MFSTPGVAPGFIRRIAPSASLRLTRAVVASLAIAVASLGVILALTLLSARSGMAALAL